MLPAISPGVRPPRPKRPSLRRAAARAAIGVLFLGVSGSTALLGAGSAFAADAFFPPVAVADGYGVNQGSTLHVAAPEGLLINDTFSDAGPIQVSATWAAGDITVHPDGSFTYTPDPAFSGTYTFDYTVIDQTSHMESEKATVTITVFPKPNSAPVANPDSYGMIQGTTLDIPAPGVLANDTDADGDPLTVVGVKGHDSATTVVNTSGSLKFTPDPGFVGVTSFEYRAADDELATSNWTTVTITVSPKAAVEPPVAKNDAYTTPKNTQLVIPAPGVLANDSVPTGKINDWDDKGLDVKLADDGSFVYTPAPGFVGTVSFGYDMYDPTADDGQTSNWATVTVTVTDPGPGTTPGPKPTPKPGQTPANPTPASTPELAKTGGVDTASFSALGAALLILAAGGVGGSAAWRRLRSR